MNHGISCPQAPIATQVIHPGMLLHHVAAVFRGRFKLKH